jgi:cyclopropane fatty-acyl-phospholipid synthase-like methyltransferase
VETVLELGCGDGSQLARAEYPSYIGLDISSHAIERCMRLFREDASKSFFVYSSLHFVDRRRLFHADLAISLDVLYHLTEDSVFQAYLAQLFASGDQFVIIYSSNHDAPSRTRHVKHRKFTDHVPQDQWTLVEVVKNPFRAVPEHPAEDSLADFYVFRKV